MLCEIVVFQSEKINTDNADANYETLHQYYCTVYPKLFFTSLNLLYLGCILLIVYRKY